MTCIYALLDPRDEKIYYVGKTKNLRSRYFQHLKDMTYKHAKDGSIMGRKKAWFEQLQAAGLAPEFVILEEADVDWHVRERYWITRLRSEGHPLLNTFDGGQPGGTGNLPREVPAFRWWHPERGFYDPQGGDA
ncbi:GIY-YIG nuclease family protein [Deinococcus wulumuqiensis]|uniref:GIY-YIG domain-containing protein n=1 Tax=Deinococcus wulumuqiensis TaxID=980427 RepID=A0AAV4KBX3_9DEIO|nr:GIY-YIG nuclease family protein [Deinococcus wulumuqiensis]QII20086.1 GIY-YIG nuclease family protein [Deinococcus wulumuqiensis R12]GGI95237.1 hypothetical protein GCM10010914_32160 [Deinococcus wulumuqiensis]GGP30022.1 hypothetical protein GCM10008021_16730 [Deinococcus wulumuqiensis]